MWEVIEDMRKAWILFSSSIVLTNPASIPLIQNDQPCILLLL